MAFTLNGRAGDVVEEADPLPMFREMRRTERVQLRKGDNLLVVHMQPPAAVRAWALGATFTTVDGAIMTDLVYT